MERWTLGFWSFTPFAHILAVLLWVRQEILTVGIVLATGLTSTRLAVSGRVPHP